MFYLIKNYIIFIYDAHPTESLISARSNASYSLANDTNFVIRTLENKANIENFGHKVHGIWPLGFAKPLSFYVDAGFDQSKRKWLWSNDKEVNTDHWTYQCTSNPHQPATDRVVTITDTGILKIQSNDESCIEIHPQSCNFRMTI